MDGNGSSQKRRSAGHYVYRSRFDTNRAWQAVRWHGRWNGTSDWMLQGHLAIYKSLNAHRVKYVVIGGVASILYGSPRMTKDLDLFIEATPGNAARLLQALEAAGLGTASLTTPEKILANEVTILQDVCRLDILTRIKGLTFAQAWPQRVVKRLQGVRVPVVALDQLIQAKQAAGRPIDLQDVATLRTIKRLKTS